MGLAPSLGGRRRHQLLIIAALLGLALGACSDEASDHLTIAYLGDNSGDLGEFGPQIQQGVDLAIEHVNAAGGVNGQPVELVVTDTASDPEFAVEEARRLIDDEGVQAIVGPLDTASAIAVAEQVSRPLRIPTIAPSATSPALTDVDDGGYFFRSTLSDAAQGPILAQLVIAELEVDNVAVLYEDTAYGRGLLETFERAYPGRTTSVAYEESRDSYEAELRRAAAGGAQYLIAIGYPAEAAVLVRESVDLGLFDSFVFVDGTRSLELIAMLGPDVLEGARGTAPAPSPATAATKAFDDAFLERFGALPATPFVREAYDATVALALATEFAGSYDGAAIRDALYTVGNPEGTVVTPGIASIAAGLESARAQIDIDYRGAASTVEWDANGDLATGYIGIWAYQGGSVVDLETIPFDLR